MSQHAAFRVPHRVPCGSGLGGTAARARNKIVYTVGQCTTGTLGKIHLGQGGKESPIAPVCSRLDLCKCLAEQILQKGKGALVPTLSQRFWRPRELIVPWRHLRRHWCERGVRITPDAEGNHGQKDGARPVRGPCATARPPCGGFKVVCGKACCEHSRGAEHMFSPRRLLDMMFGCEPHVIFALSGDVFFGTATGSSVSFMSMPRERGRPLALSPLERVAQRLEPQQPT
jgi:hypothetical protein